jgi:hypothetical protein
MKLELATFGDDQTKIEWRFEDTGNPPAEVRLVFKPTGNEALSGTPTGDFIDADPGAGNDLVASLDVPAETTDPPTSVTLLISSDATPGPTTKVPVVVRRI